MNIIRAFIRRTIKKLPRSVRKDLVLAGMTAGDGLEGYVNYPSMDGTFRYLKRKGFAPKYAIDVGAFKGEWTSEFKAVFPDAEILMVEPQASKQHLLNAIAQQFGSSVRITNSLLGPEQDAEVVFHEMEQGSSVFMEQSHVSGTAGKRKLTTLDSLTKVGGQQRIVDFLKLDAQGYELEILKGARNTLARTELVLLEASLIQINKGCPSILEVMTFMESNRFQLLDICGQWRRPDHYLWQVDLLFVRTDSSLTPLPVLDGPSFSGWRLE